MIQVMIVEDEPLAARYLGALLHETGKVEVVGHAREAETALRLSAQERPDAVFLDIRMPGQDGLALAIQLSRLPMPPLLVFTTGHAEHAAEAFRVEAVDYLLKPLEPTGIREAVTRLEARLARRLDDIPGPSIHTSVPTLELINDRLPIKIGWEDTLRLLPKWEIVAALRHDRRTWIHTAREEFATYYPLDALLRWLGNPSFLRISRESLVNIRAIEEVLHYGDRLYRVRLCDRQKTLVEASRSGAASLAALLKSPF